MKLEDLLSFVKENYPTYKGKYDNFYIVERNEHHVLIFARTGFTEWYQIFKNLKEILGEEIEKDW